MKENLAGGYAFKATDWTALRRWLLVGSMSGAYYQGKEQMTEENVKVLQSLMKEDAPRVAQEILDASKKGISVHTPIFALTLLSMADRAGKDAFREVFPMVIRNASHLYEFFSYVKDNRGFGSLIHRVVKDWLGRKEAKELEYQFLKYQSRYDWSARDVLRVIKPTPDSELKKAVYNWMSGGSAKNPLMSVFPAELARINAYEQLKKGATEDEVIDAITKFNMTWEMMPGNLTMTNKIWATLFKTMPVGATIRNLGNLTDKEVFKDKKNLALLEERFSADNLKKAYVHPVVFASALKIYELGGEGGKSKLRWTPVPRVVDAIEKGIELSFDFVEPSGKDFFLAIDVSGSMTMNSVGSLYLAPYQVAGIMALATVKSEKDYFVGGFDTQFKVLSKFNKSLGFSAVMDHSSGVWPTNFGGTDAAQAYIYASKKNVHADVFVMYTDNESWAGYKHPSVALKEYRQKVNKNAKAIYITMMAYGDRITLVDPKDPMSYDLAGFTAETPKLINMIARGDL
jgi:60 kDa SS-A/Ro ribonucleoprotein